MFVGLGPWVIYFLMIDSLLPPKHKTLPFKLFLGTLAIWVVLGLIVGVLIRAVLVVTTLGLVGGIIYWFLANAASEKFVVDVHQGELLEMNQAPRLYETVQELSELAGIEPPFIYVLPTKIPNAFVVSRRGRSSIIGVTTGLTAELERDEVQAVMAIMVARIASGSALAWTIASALSGIPLQIAAPSATSDLVRQSPIRILLCPGFLLYNKIVSDSTAVTDCDSFAGVLIGSHEVVAKALKKLANCRPVLNSSVSPSYAATAQVFALPFYSPASENDWQTNALKEAARDVPSIDDRIANLTADPTAVI